MAEMNDKEIIARRVALELRDDNVVNLGIGLPSLVSNYLPENVHIVLHAENGILGMGPICAPGEEDCDVINAGNQNVHVQNGACFFDSATSFAIIRGGHVDVTVLGALQVDENGNLASHVIPGKMVPGMGGAMDLVAGARKVIVAMQHTAKGSSKILHKCTLPLTGVSCVHLIVTEKAVLEVSGDGLLVKEILSGTTKADLIASTDAKLIFRDA